MILHPRAKLAMVTVMNDGRLSVGEGGGDNVTDVKDRLGV